MTPAPSIGGAAPWIARQLRELAPRQGHAWLIHGPSGLGQLELGLALSRAWLCEAPEPAGSCGQCTSCRQMDARAHLDLRVMLPEALSLELGWPLDEKAQDDIDAKKRKPSREIKVDAARGMIDFAQLTRSGRRCKVVLVYPAERMNQVSANTILKTLEEPPGETRFILCSDAAHLLLPTIRSRCQQHTMQWPNEAETAQWLAAQGVPDKEATALFKLAGGRPALALSYHGAGRSAALWCELPGALARGQAGAFGDLGLADMVDALQKLCHDQMALCVGAPPRYFPQEALSRRPALAALKRWSVELRDSARIVEHPMAVGLMAESLVWQAGRALNSPGP